MYPGDSYEKWSREVLPDARIEHRWDDPKAAGKWFLEHLKDMQPTRGGDGRFPQDTDAMWDTYMLFDRDATWTDRPSSIVSWGYTIMRTREQFARDFAFVTTASTPR